MYQLNPLFEIALRQNSPNQRLYVLTLLHKWFTGSMLLNHMVEKMQCSIGCVVSSVRVVCNGVFVVVCNRLIALYERGHSASIFGAISLKLM